jgi:hypothetical protein
MAKAAARVEAKRVDLDERNKANAERRAMLVERLASGDISALDEARCTFDEKTTIETEQQLALDAKRRTDAGLQQIEREKSNQDREKERSAFEAMKSRRLAVARALERQLRSLASNLAKLEMFAMEIEAAHRRLAGERLIVPPLSRSAIGSRISEFCTGLGLDAWLPVMCAETKSPPSSFEETERLAQAEYRLPEDR